MLLFLSLFSIRQTSQNSAYGLFPCHRHPLTDSPLQSGFGHHPVSEVPLDHLLTSPTTWPHETSSDHMHTHTYITVLFQTQLPCHWMLSDWHLDADLEQDFIPWQERWGWAQQLCADGHQPSSSRGRRFSPRQASDVEYTFMRVKR